MHEVQLQAPTYSAKSDQATGAVTLTNFLHGLFGRRKLFATTLVASIAVGLSFYATSTENYVAEITLAASSQNGASGLSSLNGLAALAAGTGNLERNKLQEVTFLLRSRTVSEILSQDQAVQGSVIGNLNQLPWHASIRAYLSKGLRTAFGKQVYDPSPSEVVHRYLEQNLTVRKTPESFVTIKLQHPDQQVVGHILNLAIGTVLDILQERDVAEIVQRQNALRTYLSSVQSQHGTDAAIRMMLLQDTKLLDLATAPKASARILEPLRVSERPIGVGLVTMLILSALAGLAVYVVLSILLALRQKN